MLGQFAIDPESGEFSLRRLFQWWRQGLLCCLPGWLRRRIDPLAAPYVLTVDALQARLVREGGGEARELGCFTHQELAGDRRLAGLLKGRARSLILRSPREWVLLRRVNLPAATLENLRQVVGFEMDRLTPFSQEQVWYDYHILPRDRGSEEIAVEVAILPRSRIDGWLIALGELGVRPAAIDAPGLWPETNFVPEAARPRSTPAQRAYATGISVMLALLLGIALAVPLWQRREIVADLEERTQKAQREAGAVVEVRNRVDEARKLLEYVPAKRRETRPVVELLDGVSRVLPDHTWLQQLDLNGEKMELRGMSTQATTLISLLEKTPGFADVAFRSPVVGAEGAERFHLGARLLTSGASQ